MAGGLAGSFGWSVGYPMDTVKTLVQSSNKYSSAISCIKILYSTGGIAPFFKGFVPCVVRAFPANAALFYIYELCIAVSWKFYKT